MKEYKKPLIEDEMIEKQGVGSGDNVEKFPSL